MSRIIKKLKIANLQEALNLVWDVFLVFEAPHYNDEGIQEFKSFIEYESIKIKLQENQISIWGCFYDENLVGVLATRPACHICLLFVDKSYHRKGIARSLFNTMTEYYRTNTDYLEITVFFLALCSRSVSQIGI